MTSPARSVLLSSSLSELFGKDCDPRELSFIKGLVSTLWELLPPKDLDSPFKLNPRDRLSEFSIVREELKLEKIDFGNAVLDFGRSPPSFPLLLLPLTHFVQLFPPIPSSTMFSSTLPRSYQLGQSINRIYSSSFSPTAYGLVSRSRMAVSPSYRLSTHAMYDYGRMRNFGTEALKRYKVGGERLKLTRMLALAMAAMALEASRKKALCDAAYVERSGILEGHSSMTYWSRFKRALNAFKRVGILTCLFTPATVMVPLSLATKKVLPQVTEMTWDYILYSIGERMGGSFVCSDEELGRLVLLVAQS